MKYLWGTSFTVPMGGDEKYRANWDATFGAKKKEEPAVPCPCESGQPFSECHGKTEEDPADA